MKNMYTINKILRGGASKQLVLLAFFIIAVSFIFQPLLIIAQTKEDANDTITLDVNISSAAAIEVLPTAIDYNQLIPGTNGTVGTPEEVRNISIKNIGSYNLTQFYIDIGTEDVELSNPIAGGEITDYAAGGFMLIRNETETENYYHAGRLEWNLSEDMDTEVLEITAGTLNYSHGWYRKANGNEYLWKVENGTCGTAAGLTAALCNCTDTNLVINNLSENSSGYARDLSIAVATAPTPEATNINWSLFHYNTSQGGPLQGHCVAVHRDCEKIMIYKYDMTGTGSNGFGACREAQYIANERLEPGERLDKIKIKPSIPFGVPAGDSKTSILGFYTSIDSG